MFPVAGIFQFVWASPPQVLCAVPTSAPAERAQPPPLWWLQLGRPAPSSARSHPPIYGGSRDLLLALVTFACLFSGVLDTLGKRDRGVMQGNHLPVPLLFALLWTLSFPFGCYHLFLKEQQYMVWLVPGLHADTVLLPRTSTPGLTLLHHCLPASAPTPGLTHLPTTSQLQLPAALAFQHQLQVTLRMPSGRWDTNSWSQLPLSNITIKSE